MLTSRARRVCLLSGGGDAPGVNAIVRGFVHAAHRASIEVVGCHYGFEGLLDPRGSAPLALEDVRGILPRGGSILGCSTRINPFFVPLEGGGIRDMGASIVDRLRSSRIDALVLIGGDGTMLAAERFMQLGMECIGIPKTIDDDLAGTDPTGFDTAVETATHALDALHSTAEAHARVMVVEVMGRWSGAIALHAGIAGGADVILVPEIPYRLERVVSKIREREGLGRRFSIVVVAEGAHPMGGGAVEIEAGRAGHLARLGGAGGRLLHDLEREQLGHEIRLTTLGHLLRGGAPTARDRILGTLVGTYAAELCRDGRFGRRVVARDGGVASLPLGAGKVLHKVIDVGGPLVHAAEHLGIEFGDAVAEATSPAQAQSVQGDAKCASTPAARARVRAANVVAGRLLDTRERTEPALEAHDGNKHS